MNSNISFSGLKLALCKRVKPTYSERTDDHNCLRLNELTFIMKM